MKGGSKGGGSVAEAGRGKGKGAKGKGGKGGKGKGGGSKDAAKRPPRRVVRNHYVALLGLAGLGLIALQMLRAELDLVGAGRRAAVVLGVVLVVERLVLPVCRAVVGPPAPLPPREVAAD